jgi:hypothetical protein
MNGRNAFVIVAIASAIATVARSGHEIPVYPSFYPHEIEIVTIAPERAAELLTEGKIQAYVGSAPRFAGAPPDSIGNVESLGSFVIVRVNPASPLAGDERSTCTLAETVIRAMAATGGNFIVHPYPVTPIHGDYLHHVDLAEAAKARILDSRPHSSAPAVRTLKVKASGGIATSLVRPDWRVRDSEWDAEIAEIGAADLIASASFAMNGWLGPAWVRTGWFHAYLLLSEPGGDENLKLRIESDLRHLQEGTESGLADRINIERSLVTSLSAGCRTVVAGYTVKREYFSGEFSAGIENIAYDSLTGLNSPIFIRTVKLKDFPWNGWLQLGIDAKPATAWNPIAGFTDEFGRLMWSAVGDPALIPSPNESNWMLNRITEIQSKSKQ